MSDLPKQVKASAFKDADGEYAWRRADVIFALQAIADSGQAILGGEVWVVIDDGIIEAVPKI